MKIKAVRGPTKTETPMTVTITRELLLKMAKAPQDADFEYGLDDDQSDVKTLVFTKYIICPDCNDRVITNARYK